MIIEIIVLVFLSRNLRKLAAERGVNPKSSIVTLVVGWIVLEIIGVVLAIGMEAPLLTLLFAYGGGLALYFFLRNRIKNMDAIPTTSPDDSVSQYDTDAPGQQSGEEEYF